MESNRLTEHAQNLPGGVKRENPGGRGIFQLAKAPVKGL